MWRLAALVALAGCGLWGQSSSGGATVQGTVRDATGAVVPDAKITITHAETGIGTAGTSNKDGFFAFPPVPIGEYRVRCEAAGMKAWEGQVQLEAGRTVEVN